MLVLTRRRDESIYIGDDIRVTVVRIDSDGRVRLGIEAPHELHIVRGELRPDPRQQAAAAAEIVKEQQASPP